ncbi:MAG: hypothetical protein H0U50_08855 [Pyrinomonadaceae bacterium]|nr:hypothetical protein [Pyrinomonadaceae bacterium]
MGVVTARDEWVYDLNADSLKTKVSFLIDTYNKQLKNKNDVPSALIKWSDTLTANFKNKVILKYDESKICKSLYKPYNHRYFYAEKIMNDRLTGKHKLLFGENYIKHNFCIGIIGKDTIIPFSALAFTTINDLNSLSNAAGGNKTFPLYVYENQKHENITDWALNQFQTHYGTKAEARASARAHKDKMKKSTLADARVSASTNGASITKQDIFYYTYGVLHSPQYRRKYEQNLKREFPRLPFYEDFAQWRDWGRELMDLHINYETQEAFALERNDLDLTAKRKIVQNSMFDQIGNKIIDDFVAKPQTKLRADKENGAIIIDSMTTLTGVPALAWEYKLGNRSALEWILDQYKEKKPSDATIAERFNTYKFEDYKEQVIDLLKRVCTVSVKTMEIVGQMPGE